MNKKILIAEDDIDFANFLRSVCEEELPFLKADIVENGWEALKSLTQNPEAYFLVVTDVDMFPIGGDDLVTIIDILNKHKVIHVRTLMMSGKIEQRPGDFMEKPFTAEEFGAKVFEVLDHEEPSFLSLP